ncbi:RNA polymerase sigma factor [Chitinophaga lutea]|uniref:RNA polymerase sigma factor n=1 Tax=Chitinophaga lutea TaxID=2488634 RepID=UPI00131590BF|nr:sigma-70 family RNA polymerase sigma factor [Chitinophaga lutea]
MLILQVKRGDKYAFNLFFKEFYAPLFYYCRHLVQDEEEARDIVLGTFQKFWEKRDRIQNYRNARSFLYLVAKNAGLDYLKQTARKLIRHNEYTLLLQAAETDPDYLAMESVILQRVYREVEKLPGKCRKVFELSFLEGKSIDEIAGILGISPGNVSSQRSRALQLLRISLADAPLALLYLFHSFFNR